MAHVITETPPELMSYATPYISALIIGINPSTVYDWMNTGKRSFVRWHGNNRLVLVADVQKLASTKNIRGRPRKPRPPKNL